MSYRLGEICEIVRGGSPRPIMNFVTDSPDGVNWLKIGDVSEFDKYFIKSAERITKEGALHSREVEKGDLILSNSMSFGRPFITLIAGYIHDGWLRVRNDPNLVDREYLYYFLSSDLAQNQFQAVATGSVVNNLKSETVKAVIIDLPPLPEQREIAATLSAIDARIAVNRTINHHLEQMAQAIFKSWFVDFEPWGGEQPPDWRIIEFSSFLTPRIEKSNDPTIPLFSVTDTGICPRGEKFNKNLSKTDTRNKIARETDIVFGMSREILNWGIMRSQIGGVSSAYNVFAVDSGINSKYLESIIKVNTFYFKDLIRPATREGQGVDKDALMLKSIYLPPDGVLAEYYTIEDTLTAGIRENVEESTRLVALRDTLLPRLMSGELSVSDIDPDK